MKFSKVFVLFVLVLSFGLAACGGGRDESADAGDDSETNRATSAENGAETTAVSLADEVRVEEGGYAFQPPVGYEVNIDYIFAEMKVSGDDLTQINIVGTPFDDGMDIETMYTGFTSEFGNDDAVTLGERQPLNINELTGFAVTMEGDEDGTTVKGLLVALGNDTQGVFIFGGAAANQWDDEVAAQFDAVVHSISLFAATEAGAEETTSAAETTETAAADAAPEPTAEPAAETDEPTVEPAAETTETTAPMPVGSTDPGFACFGTTDSGMTCLTADGQWQQYTSDNSDLGSDYIADMAVCPDGNMLIIHSDGVSIFDGESFRELEGGWGYSSPEGGACTTDGNIWVAHYGGVSYYDGASWTTYESAEHLATGEQASDLVNDVVLDGDGNAWVVSANAIAKFDGSNWTRYQMGEGLNDKYFFDELTVDGNGRPWALHSSGLLQFDGEAWVNHENNDFFSAEAFAVGPTGALWLATYSNGLYSFDGSTWTQVNTSNSDISADDGRAMAFDNNGRLYVGTVYGLNVLDGGSWTTYNMDSAELVSHNINTIGIVNGGPTLPALMDKENGAVTGSFEADGAPLAEATVELCVRELYSSYSGDTPCADQPLSFTTTTDADGAFAFKDVPVGVYYIVFETDNGWGKLTDEFGIGSEEIPVDSGETTDVGLVTLASE